MAFHLRAATDQDLPFARSLTFAAMSRYYRQYGLVWSNDGFDVAWAGRENWLVCNEDGVMGFISLSRDSRALYIRELHMLEACRGLGAGSWVLEQMALKAQFQVGVGLAGFFVVIVLERMLQRRADDHSAEVVAGTHADLRAGLDFAHAFEALGAGVHGFVLILA